MLNQRIKKLRESLDMTQEEFAKNLSMSGRSVQRWEAGLQSIQETSLRMIELVFNVNPEWLRNGKDEMFLPAIPKELEPVVEWMKNLSDAESTKLRSDLEQKYELLRKWLEK